MAKSAIYLANTATQTIAAGGTVDMGATINRIGCGLAKAGMGVELSGSGYYAVTISISAAPATSGVVSANLLADGVAVSGATASGNNSAVTNLSIVAIVRNLCCHSISDLTVTLSGGTVSNIATVVEKL